MDEVASVKGKLVPQASNPVSWQQYVGGVGGNAARAALSVYQNTGTGGVNLHAAIGDDTNGEALISRVGAEGLTVRPQFIDGHATGRYSAIMSESGDLELGLADVQLAERLHPKPVVSACDYSPEHTLLVDANLSTDCLTDLIDYAEATTSYVAALTVSPHKAVRLLYCSHYLNLLFCNRREAYALAYSAEIDMGEATVTQVPLQQLSDALITIGFRDFVLTDGGDKLIIRSNGTISTHQPPPVKLTHNVNGAGDTLAGATLAAVTLGKSLEEAVVEYGVPMAAEVLNGNRLPLAL